MRRTLTICLKAGILSAGFLAMTLTSAQAKPPAPTPCQLSAFSEPFLAWGDSSAYVLVPGSDGSFAGWNLEGDAGQVSGGYGGASALELADGAVATAPGTCVNIPHPTTRFFVRADTPGTTVDVAAVVRGEERSVFLGSVTPTAGWEPSPSVKIRPTVVAALHGGTALVTLRFTARGGNAQIDDVYIDPWSRG